jgi:uncharacterized membrane protein
MPFMWPDRGSVFPREGSAWPALDLVKFWCVLWMILLHTFFWVATEYGYITFNAGGRAFAAMRYLMVLGFFPLMLPVTAGCAFRLSLSPNARLQPLDRAAMRSVLVTSAFICCAGFAMNVLSVDLKIVFAWNVLQLVACSYLVIGLVLTILPVEALIPLAVAILVVTPVLRHTLSGRESYWALAMVGRVPSGFGWPLFPWVAAVIFGFIISGAYLRFGTRQRFPHALLAGGVVLTIIPLVDGTFVPALDRLNLMGARLFNPPPTFILGVFGVSAICVAVATFLSPVIWWRRRGIVASFSKGILWVYVCHMVVGTRLYELLHMHFRREGPLMNAGPFLGPAIAIAFPLLLIATSWATGYAVIRLFGEKVIHITVRRR